MKKTFWLFISIGFFLSGCEQEQQAPVEPKTMAAVQETTLPGANLRPISRRVGLTVSDVTLVGTSTIAGDGSPFLQTLLHSAIYQCMQTFQNGAVPA